MERYVFSGSLTDEMHDILVSMPGFEPLNILVSQIDRSGVSKAIEWKHAGFCKWLFVDSGAFSVHTGRAKCTADEYIDYINSIDDDIDVFAQLDTIPGHFGKPKSSEDYAESAAKSWDNYLYMRQRVKSPNKVMPVMHFGESFGALTNMLEYRDESGNLLEYIGLSPANDVSTSIKDIYLKEVFDLIKKSSNPNVKTHLYGYTSLQGLSKFPCYSADSITHRLLSGYAKVISRNFGVVSVTTQATSSRSKDRQSFLEVADEHNKKIFQEEVESMGLTLDQIQESHSARAAMNIYNISKMTNAGGKYAYASTNAVRAKSLFGGKL